MVVTSFINLATPLVRYRIGDQVEIQSDEEYVNSYTDDIEIQKIIGRQMDYLVRSGNNRVMNVNLSWIIDRFEEKVIQFQFIQKEKHQFVVNMVTETTYDKNTDEDILRGRLERQLGAVNHYQFNYIDNIPKEKSGKVRFIINEMSDVG
jgi:phenylacetate-CoA ligase